MAPSGPAGRASLFPACTTPPPRQPGYSPQVLLVWPGVSRCTATASNSRLPQVVLGPNARCLPGRASHPDQPDSNKCCYYEEPADGSDSRSTSAIGRGSLPSDRSLESQGATARHTPVAGNVLTDSLFHLCLSLPTAAPRPRSHVSVQNKILWAMLNLTFGNLTAGGVRRAVAARV